MLMTQRLLGTPNGLLLVGPGFLSAPLNLTRAQITGVQSSAVNSTNDGLTFYGADVPRFNGPAQRLLIEGQTINRARQPVSVSDPTGAWFQFNGTATPTITPNFSVSPGGLQDAARVRWVGPNAGTVVLRVPTSGVPANVQSTVSFWALTRNLADVTSIIIDAGDFGPPTSNLLPQFQAGVWSRVVGHVTPNASSSQWLDFNFFGFTTGEIDIDLWGVQVEERSFATSLVLPPAATPGASTRGVDLVSASLASLGIPANGACTVLWSGLMPAAPSVSTEGQIIFISDGTQDNRFRILSESSTGNIFVARRTAGAETLALCSGGARPTNSLFRVGISIDGAGRAAASLNGGAVAVVTGGPTAGLTTFNLGSGLGVAPMFAETGHLRVLPFSVSDSELQSLTGAMP